MLRLFIASWQPGPSMRSSIPEDTFSYGATPLFHRLVSDTRTFCFWLDDTEGTLVVTKGVKSQLRGMKQDVK